MVADLAVPEVTTRLAPAIAEVPTAVVFKKLRRDKPKLDIKLYINDVPIHRLPLTYTLMSDRLEVRMDILDYYCEIERFDRLVGQLLRTLDEAQKSDNTIVVVTSDHGMPFARGKANLYDLGVRVPLAIRWPARIKGGRTLHEFVSLTDLAPTFLEAVGESVDPSMTGKSLLDLLLSPSDGRIDRSRTRIFFGKEIGVGAFYGSGRLQGYPNRAIRTEQFLYIRNYGIDRMPGYNAGQGGCRLKHPPN